MKTIDRDREMRRCEEKNKVQEKNKNKNKNESSKCGSQNVYVYENIYEKRVECFEIRFKCTIT